MTSQRVLGPGDRDTLCLYLQVENVPTDEVTPDSWTTIAEITEFDNSDGESKNTDADSVPDDDFTNDPGGNPDDDTDNELDGDGSGDPTDPEDVSDPELDEDDHDPEILYIGDAATIIYTLDEAPDAYYEIVKFNIHPNAIESFNEQALNLVDLVKATPRQSKVDASFETDIRSRFNITAKDIVGNPKEKLADYRGNIIGRYFESSGIRYALEDSEHELLAALAKKIQRLPAFRDRLSQKYICLLYTSPSPRDRQKSRMPSSA